MGLGCGAGHGQPRDGSEEMTALYWLSGLAAAGLFVYLIVALVRAEEF